MYKLEEYELYFSQICESIAINMVRSDGAPITGYDRVGSVKILSNMMSHQKIKWRAYKDIELEHKVS